jgi:hypothetical protein
MRHAGITILLLWTTAAAAQYDNVRVSNLLISDPEEVSIAVDPADPQRIAVGSNLRYLYTSMDGGQTWTQSTLPAGTWGDPCLVYDGLGNLYYAHLANLPTGHFIDRLIVHRSINGGVSWADSAEVGYSPPRCAQDKEWLAVDLTGSSFQNTIYMAWTEFDSYGSPASADSSRILFSHSTDHGKSWSASLRVSDRAGDCIDDDNTVEGAVPAVGPNGEVYVSWAGPLGIMFDKSTDGGKTFGTDQFVASQPGGWAFDVSGIYRCNGLPVTVCDVSASPHRGTIYVVWSDQRNGLDNTDLFLTRSTDGGTTWSPALRVNDDMTVSQQFFHWCCIDQSTGWLYAVFYDRRRTTGDETEVSVARSTDGGLTFKNFPVSESSFIPSAGVFFGDYITLVALNGMVYPVWTRMDAGRLSVWMARVGDTTATDVVQAGDVPREMDLRQNYPNPFNPMTVISYQLPVLSGVEGPLAGDVRLVVYDLLGRELAVLVNEKKAPGTYEVEFDGTGLASGVYIYRLTVGQKTLQRSMVHVK